MSAVVMPGGPVADAVFADLAPRIDALRASGRPPGLATLLIGDDEPSSRYVGMKMRKAEELGCHSPHVHLHDDATTAEAIAAVQRLNADPAVDAMLDSIWQSAPLALPACSLNLHFRRMTWPY